MSIEWKAVGFSPTMSVKYPRLVLPCCDGTSLLTLLNIHSFSSGVTRNAAQDIPFL